MKSSQVLTPEVYLPAPHAIILVVEDELLIRMMLSENLRHAGYEVIEAASADHALKVMTTAIPDLVITDVRMPGRLDGIGLLAELKQANPTLPVIVSSGHLQALEVMEAGADNFVQKPYSFEHMLQTVQIELAVAP